MDDDMADRMLLMSNVGPPDVQRTTNLDNDDDAADRMLSVSNVGPDIHQLQLTTTKLDELTETPAKTPTTFHSLPPELRNYIYDLSRCLDTHLCGLCTSNARTSGKPISSKEPTKSGTPIEHAFSHCGNPLHHGIEYETTKTFSLWVNRSSHLAKKGSEHPDKVDSIKKVRAPWISDRTRVCHAWTYGKLVARIAQPPITKVSKQVRDETLSIFYGQNSFLLTLLDREIDHASILKWLRTIGPVSAAKLRNVKLVYRKKKARYIKKKLLPDMKKLGVKVDEGVVTATKLEYPFCYCEECIRKAIGECE